MYGNCCITTFVFTGFACVLEYTRFLPFASTFGCASILVDANNRMRIPFGIAPSENVAYRNI